MIESPADLGTKGVAVEEIVSRPLVGLNARPILIMAFGGFIALAGGKLGAFAGGMVIMASARDLWALGETLTFSNNRVRRSLPGKGRFTWWLDGNASLHYVDGIREPGRWGLPTIHEGLGLVYPAWDGEVFDLPPEYDSLKLLPGRYSSEPEWAAALLTAIRDGHLKSTPEAEDYLRTLAQPLDVAPS